MPKYKLMAHQRDGVKFLDSVDGVGALLYDPGVGKTGTTMAWLDTSHLLPKEVRVLVVAPLTAADTWVLQSGLFMDSPVKARMMQGSTETILTKIAQARDWTRVPNMPISINHKGSVAKQLTGRKVTILSVSAGAISSYCKDRTDTVRMLRAIRKYDPHVIVMDESHIIKAATSNISKSMYQIGQCAPHRIILTGTVTPLSDLDVYGQWRFFAPWTFSDSYGLPHTDKPLTMTAQQAARIEPWTIDRFETRYGDKTTGYKGKTVLGSGVNNSKGQELWDRVAERSHVVKKEDALDLPPTSDSDVHVALTTREMKAYREMAEDLAAELESGEFVTAKNALVKYMKLRQVHAGFLKDTETGEVHIVGDSLQKAAIEVVTTQLMGEQRVVLTGYFRSECKALAEKVAKIEGKRTRVMLVTGETKQGDRLALRQAFGDVSRNGGNFGRTIMVAQARTMSLSVNELVTAQHMVNTSPSERRADYVQLRDRLDRKGQTKPVTFWECFAPGLVADIMINKHKTRGDLEAAMLEHIRSFARKK